MILTQPIGSSKSFLSVLEDVNMVAPLACAVLIQGETGTGKEIIARAIHDRGSRRNRPFVAINCAAIPAALLESELFGHERGAFTGAVTQTAGRFLAAHGGTLFLDEVGDLPIELQPKLLRVLQEKEFERIGSNRTTKVDVRVIAATNLGLAKMVAEKTFRADLYYRLGVFPIALPPLRERKEDIPALVHHFVDRFNATLGRHVNRVPGELLDMLAGYSWPGNIRELQNFVERALITSVGDTLAPRPSDLRSLIEDGERGSSSTLSDLERIHIERTLHDTNWVISGRDGAAARLGLPRTTLISRMQKLGITRPTCQRAPADNLLV